MKSLAADGGPCRQDTTGVLLRRPVRASHPVYIGKESNELDDAKAGLLHHEREYLTRYGDARGGAWHTVVLPILRLIPTAMLVAESGLSRSAVKYIKAGAVPRAECRETLVRVVSEWPA